MRRVNDRWFVDDDAYYNLDAALYDLRRTNADRGCIRTLERVQKKILRVMKLCEKFGARSATLRRHVAVSRRRRRPRNGGKR